LFCVSKGLAGPDRKDGALVSLAKVDPEKTFVLKVLAGINALMDTTDKSDALLDDLILEVRTNVRNLETALRNAPVAAKPASLLKPATDTPDGPGADVPGGDLPFGAPVPRNAAPRAPAPRGPAPAPTPRGPAPRATTSR
jgi:hypothetical protein